ncbi:MAG: PIN domain-containing protein [Acetobacteraceae bacterium]|nr:PIN domain-containing protein [Acetobacteraceae bacterium]
MFANRFTAFVDACVLAGALKRNVLCSLAEAEFFRIRWSERVLDETRGAISTMLSGRGVADAAERAERACAGLREAFEDATVCGWEAFECVCPADLPDAKDAHVVAAAAKTRADVIVTDNLRHFPAEALVRLGMEARSADAFVADTIALDVGRAVAAIRRMRERFRKPELDAEGLLTRFEAGGLLATADLLRPHRASL